MNLCSNFHITEQDLIINTVGVYGRLRLSADNIFFIERFRKNAGIRVFMPAGIPKCQTVELAACRNMDFDLYQIISVNCGTA